ncbi:UDP-N-acetylmuramate--L-alanine ligase [[Clostridium] ultunense Esp]|uniref:UDP-N-acetylmuramate--L-alanine ligase n=1 Tax=[Clostridium] ultunense Esp TaxID=1288971 RepID=M1ZF62_9FIRM|nr:UDP-N-acetylmuramate--L-alanine ligase [Schnuerera ultunensis]CCQ97346.1 UDP-N-acetylmuramate--L-alanine ligase [[Clostridium] ultunense Esp]SHD78407.1 UDP-N-acetylmuramate--L-alanine ligase [[Clostridium] ultunense Esp]
MFEFCINDHNYSHVHFIGIGGISMSGLAEILLTEGYKVSGSDMNNSYIVERLKNLGADIYIGHSENNIKGADLIVYTDAISKDNEELIKSLEDSVPTVDRATFLGALMKNYENSIAVSGTHGKTTTTSMIATILNRSLLKPTILLGGQLDEIGGNVKLGTKKYLLTEACEYRGNILKYYPTIAIILNMEEEHLDYFEDINHIVDTFTQYGQNIYEDGYLIINSDDSNARKVIGNTRAKIITFGLNSKSDYSAENISFTTDGYPRFMLNIKDESLYPVKLNVMGIHNVYNALASISATHTLGVPIDTILESIEAYKGTHRRLEVKGIINGIKIIDDYAHHPTEIKASLRALKNSTDNRIWCIFQPHTYTRTKILLNSFAESFSEADKVIIPDIYAAREKDNGLIHSTHLVEALLKNGIDAKYISSFDSIEDYILDNAKKGDVVVTMGAGNVYTIGESLLENNKKEAI